MSGLTLAAESTDPGAMERLFLLETADPAQAIYSRTESIRAMRWMKRVVDNRLAAPRKSRFGEPADATTETDIISVGNQFAGFGNYPTLDSSLAAKLYALLHIANLSTDRRSVKYAAFVQDAITTATEAQAPVGDRVANLAAWRTTGTRAPGGEFRLHASLQGNDFYTASPMPPPHRHASRQRRR